MQVMYLYVSLFANMQKWQIINNNIVRWLDKNADRISAANQSTDGKTGSTATAHNTVQV